MFTTRRSLRLWAARVLRFWVLGLAIGVVQACVLKPAHSPAAPAQVHEAAGHEHGSGEAAADENCLDFCSKASISAPHDAKPLDGLVSAPARTVMLPASPFPLQQSLPFSGEGAPGPGPVLSIPISFLRLAL